MADDHLDHLDGVVRRGDPDRWLSTRFVADRARRADVVALYAFDHELARARRVASNPLIAEMRLTWWGEAVEEIWSDHRLRPHPVVQALAGARRRHNLPRQPFEAMIEARIGILERTPLGLPEALAWSDAVGGSAALLAAMTLDAAAPAEAAIAGGRVWGIVLLLRMGLVDREAAVAWLRGGLLEARREGRRLGAAAFPAIVQATLARGMLKRRDDSPLLQRVRLVWAVSTGRL